MRHAISRIATAYIVPQIVKIRSANHFGRKMSATEPRSAPCRSARIVSGQVQPAATKTMLSTRSSHNGDPGPAGDSVGNPAVEGVHRAETQNPKDDGVDQLDLEQRDLHRAAAAGLGAILASVFRADFALA